MRNAVEELKWLEKLALKQYGIKILQRNCESRWQGVYMYTVRAIAVINESLLISGEFY